jgi:CheY-like chemotaxis protein/HPt (histidine-containing phosphotransfer) domain-containing protein
MQPHESPLFNARLLLAEDNSVNQDIAARVLEHLGCRVVTAKNGTVAERLLAQERFDLVLMDCEMPELDGFEVTRRFRLSERAAAQSEGRTGFARTPVVALTAHAADEGRQKCLAAGMDDLLTKPYKKAQLCETLRRWIGDLERPAVTAQRSGIDGSPDARPVARAAPDNPAIDRSVLDDFLQSQGEPGFALLGHLLRHFAETAPSTVAALREKYQARLPEDIWRLAHGLRSGATALGVRQLSIRLSDIEKNARTQSLETLEPMLALLERDLDAALESISILIGEFDARAR